MADGMNDWVRLAERCEQAMGPDRDIERCMCSLIPEGFQTLPNAGFTSSLDAITALIDRELPGWRVRWHTDGDGVHEAFLEDKGDFDAIDARHTETFAASPALALCAAFCRAMNEKEANA